MTKKTNCQDNFSRFSTMRFTGTLTVEQWEKENTPEIKARRTDPTEVFTPKKVASCLLWYSKGKLQSDMNWHLLLENSSTCRKSF